MRWRSEDKSFAVSNPVSRVVITDGLGRPEREGRDPVKVPFHEGKRLRMSSSCPLLVTVTPRARFPLPSTEFFCAPRRAARAASSLLNSTKTCESVFPRRSRRTCTSVRDGELEKNARIKGGVMS